MDQLDMSEVRDHYGDREDLHHALVKYFSAGDISAYVPLALGIDDWQGNYSASRHGLGQKILSESSPASVFNLAEKLFKCVNAQDMLKSVYDENLPYLKIGVGSEMAMMLKPNNFWVANTRSVWAHLLVKHKFDYDKADEELALYRGQDPDSEMAYEIWRSIYPEMENNLLELGNLGNTMATKLGFEPGELKFIWCDCIANALYTGTD